MLKLYIFQQCNPNHQNDMSWDFNKKVVVFTTTLKLTVSASIHWQVVLLWFKMFGVYTICSIQPVVYDSRGYDDQMRFRSSIIARNRGEFEI
jgi:hypothetical protein